MLDPSAIDRIQQLMTDRAGVLRSGPGLAAAADELRKIGDKQSDKPELTAWETTNLHLLATALVASATLRTETRGSHWREDYPSPSDSWLGHLVVNLAEAEGRTGTQSGPLLNAPARTDPRPARTVDGIMIRFVPQRQEQA
jgi:L-aspartate oxidase